MSNGRPKTIGRYEPGQVQLRGYLGTLFDGTVTEGDGAGQPVSIRLVTRELMSEDDRDRIATSARVYAGLTHPSVVAFRDVVDGDQFAVVSEAFAGDGVRTLLRQLSVKRTLVGIDVALRITRDILDGIAQLHTRADRLRDAAGRGYGGLTPDSFIVDLAGRTRLLEPGVECAISRSDGWAKHSKRLGYDAPEIFGGAPASAASDVFTAAAIAWEILLNKRLLPGTSFDVVARRWKSGDLPRADAQKRLGKDDTPKGLADILARGLDLDPAGRYPDVEAMIDALDQLGIKAADHTSVAALVGGLAIRKPQSLRPPPGEGGYVPRLGTMMGVGPKDQRAPAAPAAGEQAKSPRAGAVMPTPARAAARDSDAGDDAAAAKKEPPTRAGVGRRQLPPRRKPAAPPAKKDEIVDELSTSELMHHSSAPPRDDDADEPAASPTPLSPVARVSPSAEEQDEDVPVDVGSEAPPAKDSADAGAAEAPSEDDDDAKESPAPAAAAKNPAPAPALAKEDDEQDQDDEGAEKAKAVAKAEAPLPAAKAEPKPVPKAEFESPAKAEAKAPVAASDVGPADDADDSVVKALADLKPPAAAEAKKPPPQPVRDKRKAESNAKADAAKQSPTKSTPPKAADKAAAARAATEPGDAEEPSSKRGLVVAVLAVAAVVICYAMFMGGKDETTGGAPTTTTAARTTTQARPAPPPPPVVETTTTAPETTTESVAVEEPDAGSPDDTGDDDTAVAAKTTPVPTPKTGSAPVRPRPATAPTPRPAPKPKPKQKPKKDFVPDDI